MTPRPDRTLAQQRRHDADTFVRRRRILGVVVLLVAGLLTTLLYVKPDPFADTQTVRIAVDDAGGTDLVGGEVRMAGTPVGKVTGRERVGDDAILTLEIEDSAGPITQRARADIRPRTPFEGPVYIALSPGPRSAPALGGAVLPRSRTRNYVQLDRALRFAQPPVRASLRDVVSELHGALAGSGADGLRHALRAAPTLTRELAPAARSARGVQGTELRTAVRKIGDTVEAVADQSRTLVPMARGTARTFSALRVDDGQALGRTIDELPARLAGLDAGGRRLATLVTTLRDVGTELRPTLRAVPPTTSALTPLLREAPPVLRDTTPLLRDLRSAVSAGGRAAAPGRSLLEALRPTLPILNDSLLPELLKPTDLGVPAYLQFLSLFQGGGGASRGFQTAAQAQPPSTGPGHFMRFNARFFTGAGYPLPPCSALTGAAAPLAQTLAANGGCAP